MSDQSGAHEKEHHIEGHRFRALSHGPDNARFIVLLDQHWPAWRKAQMELNALPLG